MAGEIQYREIPLNGRLRTAPDQAELVSANGVIDFQTLQNMRYTDSHPQGISGATKINTTVLPNPQPKSLFHWRKDSPAEEHLLVSSRDSNGANQKVYRNSTAVPTAGDFTATALFTDTAGYGVPAWSTAPTEKLVYCNGKDTAIWGGSEMRPMKFYDYDPNGTYKYDFTDAVTNALTDAANVATLHRYADTIDANTMLLLHLDNAVTDVSPTTPHTVTNNNVTFSTSIKKFGTHAASFNGTNANLTIPDNADFDFSGGVFTVDMWIYNNGDATSRPLYYHETDGNNYFKIHLANGFPKLSVYATSSEVVALTSSAITAIRSWQHLAVVENGDSWYMFLDGALVASAIDTDRAANFTGVVNIGNDGSTNWFNGGIDELRVSNSARWTAPFTPRAQTYGSGSNVTNLLVASALPLQGGKFYVGTANATPATMTGYEWTGSTWAALAITDNTKSGNVSLAQTGTVAFSSTVATSKPKLYDDVLAYWYKFEITDCDTTTTLYQVTLDAPMQTLKELWDGTFRTVASFQVYKGSPLSFNDYTVSVFEDSWTSADTSSFVELDSLTATTMYLLAGFTEQMAGLRLHLIGGHVNTTAGTVATVYYANGVTPPTSATAWTTVGTIDDGTMQGAISFAKSGAITWNPPALTSEFKTSVSSTKGDVKPNLHFYKVVFSANLSADVQLFYVGGIPSPQTVSGHKFAVHHVDRLWLWGDEKQPLRGRCTARDTAQVLRGDDCGELFLKNTPVAGVSLFERYGSTAANVQVVCEPTRTWAIVGETIANFQPNCIDQSRGCTSALTMDAATVEVIQGVYRRVGMWQAQDAIVMCDGSTVIDISPDIRDKFDPHHANYLTAATLATTTGWIDPLFNEYHWVIPGSTEWVYDILHKRWYEAPRAPAKRISCGCKVYDSNGAPYSYGAIAAGASAGFVYRLEFGTSMDGTAIPYTIRTGDVAPTGRFADRTEISSVRLIGKAKTTTTETVAVSHYLDTSSAASVPAIDGISMANSGKRLFNVNRSFGVNPKIGYVHSLKFTVSTSNETIGFEPTTLILGYRLVGKDTR